MKVALAQLNYTIGAFEENAAKIIDVIDKARNENADLVIFSELSVSGYPPLDLLEHKYFIEKCMAAIERIAQHTENIAVVVGSPSINEDQEGKNLRNSAFFIRNKKIEHVVHKALLPTYDIFDEYRYFQPSGDFITIDFSGTRIALTICEDLWYKQPLLTNFGKNKLYTVNPMEKLGQLGFDLVINIAASPFAFDHDSIKEGILTGNAKKYGKPIIYVNQVGAHTELIFDGGSRVIDSKGNTRLRLDSFREQLMYFSLDEIVQPPVKLQEIPVPGKIRMIHDALVLGIRDYFKKVGFRNALLGLSGGIDSAVTLVLAAEALGSSNVRVLLMPSQYSSAHSVKDAADLAENLGVQYDIVPVKDIFSEYLKILKPLFEDKTEDITEENIQARIRGALLMAVSNKFGNLLLNTSNKSEIAVGYGTLYGDMMGGLSVLGDVYKTDVYKLAAYINSGKEIIPVNTLLKPPSAELKPDQKDSDSLPDYDLLDKILYNYIELRKSKDEIVNEGFDAGTVQKIISMVNNNEYKRYQAPPILRISSKAFGLGRRMPLAARYQ